MCLVLALGVCTLNKEDLCVDFSICPVLYFAISECVIFERQEFAYYCDNSSAFFYQCDSSKMATASCKVPIPVLTSDKSYERYRLELNCWLKLDLMDVKKQGLAIALSLPDNHASKIKDKVFNQLQLDDLAKSDGVTKILALLDKHLGKDELSDQYDKFVAFETYHRSTESILAYISEFDDKYKKLEVKGITLPPQILAFKLLHQSNLTSEETMLVKSGIDYSNVTTMYEDAVKSLKKFKGEGLGVSSSDSGGSFAIKTEPVFVASRGYSSRGAYGGYRGNVTRPGIMKKSVGFSGQSDFSSNQRGSYGTYSGSSAGRPVSGLSGQSDFSGNQRGSYSTYSGSSAGRQVSGNSTERKLNPMGRDGRRLLCLCCGSYRHLIKNCPDRIENVNVTTNEGDIESDEDFDSAGTFEGGADCWLADMTDIYVAEVSNAAVLDSACSSTVCGQVWLDNYIKSLSDDLKSEVVFENSALVFRFGNGGQLVSKGRCNIPAVVAGVQVCIATDVVDSDIPLLLSKGAMKQMKMRLDLENDTVEVMGVSVALNCTSSGHYCLPLIPEEVVLSVDLASLSEPDRYKVLHKLHCQFGHPSVKKLTDLLKDAKVWDSKYADSLDLIQRECESCRLFSKTPPRSFVALPMGKFFNDVVCMDLKKWRGGYILHLIDMWSRYSVSVFITRKLPSVIIDMIMSRWVSVFGTMRGLLSDNGGEFSNAEIRDVASGLNIKLHTTAGYAPNQNGLCERVHGVIDLILHKLCTQYPHVNINTLLGWANMAKNSLHSHHGFSSHQLVFGRNPNIPNILSDSPPALEGSTMSEVFAKHLNALQSAREAFVRSDADERLRRALRHKVAAIHQVFFPGESVYYKRDGTVKWLGPATVVAQDGKVVFIRHGGVLVRVTPNRLLKYDNYMPLCAARDPLNTPKEGVSEDCTDGSPNIPKHSENSAGVTMVMGSGLSGAQSDVQRSHSSDRQGVAPSVTDASGTESLMPHGASPVPSSAAGELFSSVPHAAVSPSLKSNSPCVAGSISDHNDESRLLDAMDVPRRSNRILNREMGWQVYSVQVPSTQHSTPEVMSAKLDEITKLQDFGAYEEVDYTGQTCVTTRWVVTRKGEVIKARLVARGFQETADMVTDSPTIGKAVTRICLAVASSRSWLLKSTDVKSAFLQSDPPDRDVFLVPPKEVSKPGKVWLLKKSLYGLNDAARQFHNSVAAELKRLGCIQSHLDPTLYFMATGDTLHGMILTHVDDFLHCGDHIFESRVMEPLARRFVFGSGGAHDFKYVGLHISQADSGSISVDTDDYAQSMECPEVKRSKDDLVASEYTVFRSLVGALNWVACSTRPDVAFDVIEHSSKFNHATREDLFLVCKSVKKCKVKIINMFPKLDCSQPLSLVLYSDAAFANLPDTVSSTLGYLVFLVDHLGGCCVINWRSNKIVRKCRSVLTAETMALANGLDDVLYLKAVLLELKVLQSSSPVICYVDSKSLSENIYSTKLVDDRRLRIDMAAIKQLVEDHLVSQVKWCSSDRQLADVLTKRGVNPSNLQNVLESGRLLF